MGRKSNEYKKGYQEAIEAIKKKLEEQKSGNRNSNSNSNQSGQQSQSNNGMISPDQAVGQQSQGQGGQSQSQNGQSNSNQQSSSGQSRTSKSDANQGVVRPEDCAGGSGISSGLDKVPGTPGGMIDSSVGEKIAKQEGYDPEGGSDSAVERDWKDAVLKETQKQKGNLPGNLVSKIETLYKTSSDWKKDLRKIVGHSISPEDKRQAFANKNILVTQDRIARTDKDKYDNLDYMMAWIDSSGSMSDDQLRQCLTEVYAVALAKKPVKLIVIQCDTKIQDVKEYKDVASLKRDIKIATVKGRGGTELKPCWDLLQNDPKYKKKSAELVMIFTDGYLNQYKRNPKTMRNLCWVILDNPGWQLQYKDINTKVVHIKTADIK